MLDLLLLKSDNEWQHYVQESFYSFFILFLLLFSLCVSIIEAQIYMSMTLKLCQGDSFQSGYIF